MDGDRRKRAAGTDRFCAFTSATETRQLPLLVALFYPTRRSCLRSNGQTICAAPLIFTRRERNCDRSFQPEPATRDTADAATPSARSERKLAKRSSLVECEPFKLKVMGSSPIFGAGTSHFWPHFAYFAIYVQVHACRTCVVRLACVNCCSDSEVTYPLDDSRFDIREGDVCDVANAARQTFCK